jgi:hypothetical protein
LIIGLVTFIPSIEVKATVYNSPNLSVGYTKVLEVTVLDEAGINETIENGTEWIQKSFGENANILNAKKKFIVKEVKSDILTIESVICPVYNISVDIWNWTIGELQDDLKNSNGFIQIFKNPANLTYYSNYIYNQNLTTFNSADLFSGNSFLDQLPDQPEQYLNDIGIIWQEKWAPLGRKIIHNAEAGDYALHQLNFLKKCTETWSYDENGVLTSYEIVNENGKTVYKFEIQNGGIPGYEIPIFLGIAALSIGGTIILIKRKHQI